MVNVRFNFAQGRWIDQATSISRAGLSISTSCITTTLHTFLLSMPQRPLGCGSSRALLGIIMLEKMANVGSKSSPSHRYRLRDYFDRQDSGKNHHNEAYPK